MAAADRLAERIDALAVALRDAGVAPERVASILGTAAEATMNALVLDAVLAENRHVDPPLPEAAEPTPLRVAA
jgi:hypothetical protein